MKKIVFSILAIAAVASCAKTEPTFEQPGEISFSPVSKYNTKAAVTGEVFSSNQDFYVFANTVDANENYFSNVHFVKATDQTGAPSGLTVYTGNPSQFWPNVKTLKFAGVTESGNIGTETNEVQASMTTWGTMTVTDYTQPLPTVVAQNDLMWFFDDNNSNGYGKGAGIVQPEMKHALSWITIKINASEDLVNDSDDTESYWKNLKVEEVKFENLLTTSTATMNTNTVTWNPAVAPMPANAVTIFTDKEEDEYTAEVEENAVKVTTSFKEIADIESNTIVIPQTPVTLSVKYSYTSPAGASVTETKTAISLDYNGSAAWVAGMHYTYELTIGADEIKIAPSSAEWTNYGATAGNTSGTPIQGTI